MSEILDTAKVPHDAKRNSLYAHKDTLACAVENHCVACLHKLYPKQPPGTIFPPNVRPEMCHRSRSLNFPGGLYQAGLKQVILTVGDGDFSFSLSLATGLTGENTANSTIVATSNESEVTVTNTYTNAASNTIEIRKRGGVVFHDVDAANMSALPCLSPYIGTVDIVVWNFPCKSMVTGADAQVAEIAENQTLLREFFCCVQEFLRPVTGTQAPAQVHISHKTYEPFCWWNVVQLAEEAGLHFEGSMVFDRYLYPGYVNKKALADKSFPFHDAQTYVFSNRKTSDRPQTITEESSVLAFNTSLVLLNDDIFQRIVVPVVRRMHSETSIPENRPRKKRKK